MITGVVVRTQRRSVVADGPACVVVLSNSWMLVRRGGVVVLRMIVVGIGVNVQRRDVACGRSHNQSEQDSYEAMHDRSLRERSATVNGPRVPQRRSKPR